MRLKHTVTLKPALEVSQGHWNWHHSIESIWLPISNYGSISCRFPDTALQSLDLAKFTDPMPVQRLCRGRSP